MDEKDTENYDLARRLNEKDTENYDLTRRLNEKDTEVDKLNKDVMKLKAENYDLKGDQSISQMNENIVELNSRYFIFYYERLLKVEKSIKDLLL